MSFLRSGIIIIFWTLICRLTGIFREFSIAYIFGTSLYAEIVNVALRLPNLFRKIFSEGALSSAFVPSFNKEFANSPDKAKKFSSQIMTVLFISLSILVIIIEIFMPQIVHLIAPGFVNRFTDNITLTILLCRITMPYIICISISSLIAGILSSFNKFAAFAFIPVFTNIGIIVATLIYKTEIEQLAINICISVIITGLLQIIFMKIALRNTKFSFLFFTTNLEFKKIKEFLRNFFFAGISASSGQLNVFITQIIASFLPGAIAVLSYADRLYYFPLSLIGVAFSTVLLPNLSKLYANGENEKALNLQQEAIKFALFLSIPSSAGLIILVNPIIEIIYEHGHFNPSDTLRTANIMKFFVLGLPAFIISKIMLQQFYSIGNTKIPCAVGIISLVVNSMLNIVLINKFGECGLAFASSFTSWTTIFWLHYFFYKNIKQKPETLLFIVKILLATILMSCLTYLMLPLMKTDKFLIKIIYLLVTSGCSTIAFVAIASILNIYKIKDIKKYLN